MFNSFNRYLDDLAFEVNITGVMAVSVGCRTMTFPAALCIMKIKPFSIKVYTHTEAHRPTHKY